MNFYLLFSIFSAILGPFQLGFNASVLNQPQAVIEQFLKESFQERYDSKLTTASMTTYFSFAVSIFSIGGMVGALSGGRIAEKYGRKHGLIYTQVFSCLGAILQGGCKYSSSYEMLVIGRLLAGFSNAIMEGISTLYLLEIAPIHIRGAIGTATKLGYTLGILTGTVLGLNNILGGDDTWPILLSLPIVPSILQTLILPFMPESPRYLFIEKGQLLEAEKALMKIRNSDNVKTDLVSLKNERDHNDDGTTCNILELLLSRRHRLALFVGTCLHFSRTLTGYVALRCYSTRFFRSSGLDYEMSEYLTIVMNAVAVMTVIVTIPLMDRVGRRTLQLTGLVGVAFCCVMITVGLNQDSSFLAEILVAVFTMMFIVFFVLGPGTIPWIATGELFSQGQRAAATSICIFLSWIGSFTVTLVFPQVLIYSFQFSLLPFAVIAIVLLVPQIIYFPETKNREFNELSYLFQLPNVWKTAIGFKKKSKSPLDMKFKDEEMAQLLKMEIVG